MLEHKGVDLFETIIRTRNYGLVAGGVKLEMGFEVPDVHARPRSSHPMDKTVSHIHSSSILLLTSMFSTMIMD